MTLLPKRYINKGKQIVLRKIRRGRVKINGYCFEPRDQPTCPELEGTRCAFGVYWTGSRPETHWQMGDFVYLWGGEEMYAAINDESFTKASNKWHKLVTKDDGYMYWTWWRLSRVQSVAHMDRMKGYKWKPK